MNEYRLKDIYPGLEESFEKAITCGMEDSFRIMTGDVNPLHESDNFAKEAGDGKFLSHVTFGMLTASLYSTLAGVYLPGKYSLIHSFEEISFLNPVYAGNKLAIWGGVSDIWEDMKLIRVKASIKNQDGIMVSKAKIKIIVMK